MASTGEASVAAPKNRPRPISFGTIFSRKPNLVATDLDIPRRSMSTRISEISSTTRPNSLRSVSPTQNADASHTSMDHLSGLGDPSHDKNGNKHSADFDVDVVNSNRCSKETGTQHGSTSALGQHRFSYTDDEAQTSRSPDFNVATHDIEGRGPSGGLSGRLSRFSFPPSDPPVTAELSLDEEKVATNDSTDRASMEKRPPHADAPSTIERLPSQIALGECSVNHDEVVNKLACGIKVVGKPSKPIMRTLLARRLTSSHDTKRNDAVPDITLQSPVTPVVARNNELKSPRTERNLHVPLLHKLRRSRADDERVLGEAMLSSASHGQQAISSFFDDASSDGDDIEDNTEINHGYDKHATLLGNARQASFRRPVLVNHPRSNSPQLGLTEILKRGPSTAQFTGARPITNEPLKGLGTALKLDEKEEKNRMCSGIVDRASEEQTCESAQASRISQCLDDKVENVGVHIIESASGVELGSLRTPPQAFLPARAGLPRERSELPVNGLRSHPTNTKAHPLGRQVTFPLTLRANETKPWEDGPVISTPYPTGPFFEDENEHHLDDKQNRKANLTVVLYGRGRGAPKLNRVSMPTIAHEVPSRDVEKADNIVMNRDFDDAALAQALFTAYQAMRGNWYARLSARNVRDIRLLGYEDMCQLSTRRAKEKCFKIRENEDGSAYATLIELYRNPKKGKGRWIWWAWARSLPENRDNKEQRRGGNLAIELVEGWTLRRILSAMLIVALIAILATILWVAAGKSVTVVQVANPTYAAPTVIKIAEIVGTTSRPSMTSAEVPAVTQRSMFPEIPVLTGVPGTVNTVLLPVNTGSGASTPTLSIGGTAPSVTVGPRDSPMTLLSTGGNTDPSTKTTAAIAQQTTLASGKAGTAGSRLGPGVGLGVLLLLLGWMMIGAWMAVSWMMV